ncbi:MAG: multidrug effflux MFS transporter [Candidatus Paracaedibacteraceae bacterium]|nr:multidrug effflux MFS transporter [Candidatus Paracaedibacteraceae bacterium]
MTTLSNKNIYSLPIILVLATIVFEMSSDLYLPSLPEMAIFYGVPHHTIVMTISTYMIGFSLMGLVGGALSDSLGRKPVFMLGMGIFVIGSIGCYFAFDIYFLTLSRLVQGMGAGISYVISTAMIKDRFSDHLCSRLFSLMGTAIALSPTVAPIIGSKISAWWGWSFNFTVILVAAVLTYIICRIGLIETLEVSKRQALNFKTTLKSYGHLFLSRKTCGYAFISGLTYGSLWAWIAVAPFFFIERIGISAADYAYYATIGPLSYMTGAFLNQFLVMRLGVDQLLKIGLTIITVGSFYLNFISFSHGLNKEGLIIGLILFCVGLAPVFSNAATRSLDVPPHQRGAASAVLGLVEMILAAVYAYGASLFNDGSMRSATVMMGGSAFLCILLYIWIQQSIKYLHKTSAR